MTDTELDRAMALPWVVQCRADNHLVRCDPLPGGRWSVECATCSRWGEVSGAVGEET